MEHTDQKSRLRFQKTVCDDFEEQAVDMNIILPDYCPDIAVILKCMMIPMISHTYQSGERCTVDGTVMLRILYLTEDRAALQCYETEQSFSTSFQTNNAMHTQVVAIPDYVNCRATGPRRLDIHGAFRVQIKAYGCGEIVIVTPDESHDICCKSREIATYVPMTQVNKAFSLSEMISLGSSIERLIYGDLVVASFEHKILANKIIMKGILRVRLLCQRNDAAEETIEEIPFSQIIDIDGLREEWHCRSDLSVAECRIHLQQNESGMAMASVSAKLDTAIRCSTKEETMIVMDAYSVRHPIVCETESVSLPLRLDENTSERRVVSLSMPLPDGVRSVVDLFGSVRPVQTTASDAQNTVTCTYTVGLVAMNTDGHLEYHEQTMDDALPAEGDMTCSAARIIGMRGMISGDKLHIQADVEAEMAHTSTDNITLVTDITADSHNPFPKTPASIRIVYANEGDSVWNIAKEHHSSVKQILDENDLSTEDIHAPTMLMIPVM